MAKALSVIALLLSIAGLGCGSSHSGPCIVLANGGRTLCGQEAKAWCESTAAFRNNPYEQGGTQFGPELQKSKEGCEEVAAANP